LFTVSDHDDPSNTAKDIVMFEMVLDMGCRNLKLELSDTIEDAPTSGGHLANISLDHKVRQIERGLLKRLRIVLRGRRLPLQATWIRSGFLQSRVRRRLPKRPGTPSPRKRTG
jgi:hypothetical protein